MSSKCTCNSKEYTGGIVYSFRRQNLTNSSTSASDSFIPVTLKKCQTTSKLEKSKKMENSVMQYYLNEEEETIEAFYALPFESKADVILFEADINGSKLFRVIREQQGVDYDYTNAKAFVKLPTVGNETKPDIFKIRLGQLAPGAEVKIELKYVTKLLPPETKASSCFCPEMKTCNNTLSISSQPGKPPISKGDVDNFFEKVAQF